MKNKIIIILPLVIILGILTILNSKNENKKEQSKERNMQEQIVFGARKYIEKKPIYYSRYYKGGYPNDNRGVCTDIIWYSFKYAGINFKMKIDEDIRKNLKEYKTITKPDPNIDFRRVRNIKIFLDRNAISLTTNLEEKEMWQPGDIIIYNTDQHIAILSDKKNEQNLPYILHFNQEGAKEEDKIYKAEITSHYRWPFEENVVKNTSK